MHIIIMRQCCAAVRSIEVSSVIPVSRILSIESIGPFSFLLVFFLVFVLQFSVSYDVYRIFMSIISYILILTCNISSSFIYIRSFQLIRSILLYVNTAKLSSLDDQCASQ